METTVSVEIQQANIFKEKSPGRGQWMTAKETKKMWQKGKEKKDLGFERREKLGYGNGGQSTLYL